MSSWELLKAHLQQPEYLHVLLNPLPVYGLALGILAMLLALALRDRRAKAVALMVVLISAGSAWPVAELGESGYDRVLSVADRAGDAWLEEHAQRAKSVLWVFYVLAALAAATICVPAQWPRTAFWLYLLTLAGVFVALGVGGWISYAGGQVRHKEFRYGPPPPEKKTADDGK